MDFETAIQKLQSRNFPLQVDFYGRLLAGYGGKVIRNSEEEPEGYYYPKDPAFHKEYGPRGVLHSYADGKLKIRAQ